MSITPEYEDFPVILNSWYTMKFEAIGSTFNAYFNDSLVLTATDTMYTEGGVLLGAQGVEVVFDDVTVRVP
jgi:hypothetical protein